MNVYVETTPLYVSRAGVARYVRGLLAGLRQNAPADLSVHDLGWAVENLSFNQPGRALKTFWRECFWAKAIAPGRIRGGVVHHTALPTIPFVRRAAHVVTLHDLALLRNPERFRSWQRRSGRRRLQRIAAADRVICPSRFTADEAIELLQLPAGRIEVIPEGGWLANEADNEEPGFMPWVPEDFFLFVGSLEPGKNLALLREIYLESPQLLPPLVIVGARWAGVAGEGTAPQGWHFLGHVSDAVLARLYSKARALLFPSRYEGFGLPVVEAMHFGCPVVCGRVASLPEVAGEAAIFAELTIEGFGAAMTRMLDEAALAASHRSAGFERARLFSWERCASETTAVYRSALKI